MKTKRPIDKPSEEDIGYLLWRLMRHWQRARQKELDMFGTTGSQLEILGAIYHLSFDHEEVTQILLSQETDIDPMTTSTILRNLEKKKLVIRKKSKTDTRALKVELTDEGLDLFCIAVLKMKDAQIKLFEQIDEDCLKDQLQKLLTALESYNKEKNI